MVFSSQFSLEKRINITVAFELTSSFGLGVFYVRYPALE